MKPVALDFVGLADLVAPPSPWKVGLGGGHPRAGFDAILRFREILFAAALAFLWRVTGTSSQCGHKQRGANEFCLQRHSSPPFCFPHRNHPSSIRSKYVRGRYNEARPYRLRDMHHPMHMKSLSGCKPNVAGTWQK